MASTPGALPRGGLLLPLGEQEGGGEGGDNHILWSPPPGTVCAQAGPAAATSLQNSGTVESMCFGKIHFAQEPRKTEDSAASALKSRARRDSQSGREQSGLRAAAASPGPRLPLVPGPAACSGPSLGQWCALGSTPRGLTRAQTPRCLGKVLVLRSCG